MPTCSIELNKPCSLLNCHSEELESKMLVVCKIEYLPMININFELFRIFFFSLLKPTFLAFRHMLNEFSIKLFSQLCSLFFLFSFARIPNVSSLTLQIIDLFALQKNSFFNLIFCTRLYYIYTSIIYIFFQYASAYQKFNANRFKCWNYGL